MIYVLNREQQLYCDRETAWRFFSDPGNLPDITPDDMGFTIISEPQSEMYEGMLIDYKVSPLLGIKLHWQTEITQVNEGHSFTDFQKKGPYAIWNHFHEFIPNEKGVLARDTVQYKLPFGILGRWMHRLVVKRKLNRIFDYRQQILEDRFNKKSSKNTAL